MSIISKP